MPVLLPGEASQPARGPGAGCCAATACDLVCRPPPAGQDRLVTRSQSPLDAALDLLVYVPVGLPLTAAEEVPRLAAKGRARVGGQVGMARVVGQFAVAQGRKELTSACPPGPAGARPTNGYPDAVIGGSLVSRRAKRLPTTPVRTPGAARLPTRGPTRVALPRGPMGRARAVPLRPAPTQRRGDGAPGAPWAPGAPQSRPNALAIPGYDSLAASQVVPRLAGLSPEELAAVGAYETAHRARRTILTRIRQLQER